MNGGGVMFGVYEVDYQGQKYFGNVSLPEFHIFNYEGNFYLVDVKRNKAHPISSHVAVMIERASFASGGLVPECVMLELRKFELVAPEKESSSEELSQCETANLPADNDFPVKGIALFIAQECNMRCIYCYGDGGEYGEKGIMSEETACLAVDWLVTNSKNTEKINICFFGGEPLLNFPLMKKTVAYAREKVTETGKQVTFSITTNGTLLNNEIISFLKDEKINPLVSFDGPPVYQNRQRPFRNGRDSYDTVYANVQKLRSVFPNLQARATVCCDSDPFLIKESLKQAGFTACQLTRVSPGFFNAKQAGISVDRPEDKLIQKMIDYNRKEVGQCLSDIHERKIDKNCLSPVLFGIEGMASGKKRHYGCGIGKEMAGISTNGDIYPCHRFVGREEMRMGNISDYCAGNLNDYHRAVVDNLPECRYCWARYFCGGGCFYLNKVYTGDLYSPDVLDCHEKKAMFESFIHAFCQLNESDKEYVNDIIKDVTIERHP